MLEIVTIVAGVIVGINAFKIGKRKGYQKGYTDGYLRGRKAKVKNK